MLLYVCYRLRLLIVDIDMLPLLPCWLKGRPWPLGCTSPPVTDTDCDSVVISLQSPPYTNSHYRDGASGHCLRRSEPRPASGTLRCYIFVVVVFA